MDKIRPMLLELREAVEKSGDFLYEVKLDGIRIVADGRGGSFLMYTRNGTDYGAKFGLILRELEERFGGRGLVLDGEAVLLDSAGRPDFYGLLRGGTAEINRGSLFYFVFDVLYMGGVSVMDKPLVERRGLLEALLGEKGALNGRGAFRVRETEVFSDGEALFQAVKSMGLEGVVAKRKDSCYKEGSRGGDWLKIKARQQREAVVLGFVEGKRNLCLGFEREDGSVVYVGNAGSGLNDKAYEDLKKRLLGLVVEKAELENVDFNGIDWRETTFVKPEIKVTVTFLELKDGGYLRNPVIV